MNNNSLEKFAKTKFHVFLYFSFFSENGPIIYLPTHPNDYRLILSFYPNISME